MGIASAKGNGLPGLAHVSLPEDMFIEKVKDVRPSVEAGMDDIIDALTKWQPAEVKLVAPKPLVFKGKDYEDAVHRMNRSFLEQHWSDGFPLIPPTQAKVAWMLRGVDLSPDEVVARLADLYRPITVRNIAINAVMAGARPEYMPVIIAAFKAYRNRNCRKTCLGLQVRGHR